MTEKIIQEELAPVVLFVYNRPDHTRKTLYALTDNELAGKTQLYIFSDGPKIDADSETLQKIELVRKIINEKPWCREVEIIESPVNLGLGTSIRQGVTEIIEKHGRAIVLEDDLITSPFFLNYMNCALDYYENRKGVFSISGYCLPPNKLKIPESYKYDVFVSLRNSSWGWATWADRWEQVDWEKKNFETIAVDPNIKEAFNRGGDDVFELLASQVSGKLDIWSIQFTLAQFANHAISIVPTRSFVDNIGLDGTGMNCTKNSSHGNSILCEKENIRFLDVLYEDKRIINLFYNSYCHKKRPLWKKMMNRLIRIIGGNNMFEIKKKIYC